MTDLHPAEILEICAGKHLGRGVVLFESVDSTNSAALRAAEAGASGVVFLAEHQYGGRGRVGRQWYSSRGKDLVVSFALRPRREPLGLTSLAALACARAIGPVTEGISIKWPNDLFIGERKIGGILAESKGSAVALGIGINVNGAGDDFPRGLRAMATSLRIETGAEQSRRDILVRLIDEFESLYVGWSQNGLAAYAGELEGMMRYMGEEVSVEGGRTDVVGIMRGIAPDGRLRLEVSGEERLFAAGNLTMRRRSR